MKVHIVSIFDKNHLARALACRQSLYLTAPEAHVTYLCLDQESYDMIGRLELRDTSALKAEDLDDAELMAARPTRTGPEFASTCKPALLLYMMKSGRVKPEDLLIFVDPDFYFYTEAQSLFKKAYGAGSIVITPHRFSPKRQDQIFRKGTYNAGIMFFKDDANSRECLEEWRKQCIEWCYLRYEDGKIGDQGYMSDWPNKYRGVYELTDKGVNLSTWNIDNYKIKTEAQGQFRIDEEKLICYHFHGLKIYFNRLGALHAIPATVFNAGIYKIGIQALREAYGRLQVLDPAWQYGSIPNPGLSRVIKQKIVRIFS